MPPRRRPFTLSVGARMCCSWSSHWPVGSGRYCRLNSSAARQPVGSGRRRLSWPHLVGVGARVRVRVTGRFGLGLGFGLGFGFGLGLGSAGRTRCRWLSSVAPATRAVASAAQWWRRRWPTCSAGRRCHGQPHGRRTASRLEARSPPWPLRRWTEALAQAARRHPKPTTRRTRRDMSSRHRRGPIRA